MSEKALASRVVPLLKSLDALRVENPCMPGTPDVNMITCWVELKQQDKWPVRASTPLRLDHDLTPQQRNWLERRIERGGRAYVLMQVARDYILLDGKVAAEIIGEATQAEIKAAAIFCVSSRELPEVLIEHLS